MNSENSDVRPPKTPMELEQELSEAYAVLGRLVALLYREGVSGAKMAAAIRGTGE